MNITYNFTLEEFEKSETAEKKGIDNTMPALYFRNVERLCNMVLEPIRKHLGCPIFITSGYRCSALNDAINGARNSQHMTGQAADITCYRFNELKSIFLNKYIQFDQAIIYKDFIHVSYVHNIGNRNQLIRKDGNV